MRVDTSWRPIVRCLVLALGVLTAGASFAQWTTQSPMPTHLDVRGVAAPTAQRVFLATDDDAFDDGGALWESADGGATWTQRDVPFSLGSPLNGVFFLDADRGWTFGNVNYRTLDGGATWEELPLLGSCYAMEFFTPTFGLASGNFGELASHDGGLSWEPSPAGIAAADFAGDLVGLGASPTGLHRTTDGGQTFAPVQAGDASDVVFLTPAVAVAIVDGAFARSIDGGATWTPGAPALARTRLTAVSGTVALALGRSGAWPDFDDRVLRSDDGGQTWDDLGELEPSGLAGLTAVTAQVVVAADQAGGLHRSIDAGATWTRTFTSPGPQPGFLSSARPVFAGASVGYHGYGAGFVVKTVDGGATWQQISSGTGRSLADVDRFPGGGLIAVGEGGTVVTSDGASPWIMHAASTPLDLVAVDAVGPQAAVALAADGRIHVTTDGGLTWTASPAAAALDGQDLHFTSPLEGWVTGTSFDAGSLAVTDDGGATWTPVPDVLGTYVAVDFEGLSGWAANVGGAFQRTTDGGATWLAGGLPESGQVADLDFWDESTGYAVGGGGYAVRSDDGGASWQPLPVPAGDVDFTDIVLLGPNELWLSTHQNAAYYSASGGQSWAVLPIGSAGFGSFAAVAATPEGEAWVVGYQGFIEHFAGPPPPPLNRPPDAAFDFIAQGLTVEFLDESFDHDGAVVSWHWDFDDGTTSAEQNPTHVFPAADTYLVRLTVTDDDGDTGTAARAVVAQPGPGGTFGDFTEVTPLDPLFVTPQDEDFWVITTAPADFDGDGDLDIAVLGYYVVYNESVVDRLVLLRNDGEAGPGAWDFAYVEVPLDGLSSGASDLSWGDPDGDGDQDLAVGTDGETVIFRNDGGALTRLALDLPGYWESNDQADFDLRSITWADHDNDGDADLLLPSVFDPSLFAYRTVLLRNDGDFSFAADSTSFAPTSHAQSAWADQDGDQDLDLLLVNVSPLDDDGFIRRYRNDGGGVFTGEDVLGALTVEHGEAQWGDYDDDGDLDILVAGNVHETDGSYDTVLRIYRNDADTFVPVDVIDDPFADGWFDLSAATWADYDSDGDMDILLAGTYNSGENIEGRALIYANENGVFTASQTQLPAPRAAGDRGGTFSWLDLDGDGDLDYFIAGQYFVPGGNGLVEAQMHVYRNDVANQNQPPSAPPGLGADVLRGAVALSWRPATDDHTPQAALTYDLEVYRGGAPVELPEYLPQPGNVSAVQGWLLTGLADGHYTWTVRAVDSAYNGGPVATGTFSLGTTAVEDDLPAAHALAPNAPNPFNPSTTLRYALPVPERVTLAVYDLKGRLVVTLVDEERPAGVHALTWSPRDVASGTYLVRLTAGDFRSTRTVTLLK